MKKFDTPARLRNACDACHKLKQRCTGAMPCENCAALGTCCSYSVAGRQGRPRGSSRRKNSGSGNSNTNTTSDKPWHTSMPNSGPTTQNILQDNDAASLDNILDIGMDGFDPELPYNMSLNEGQEGSDFSNLPRMYLTPEHEYLSPFDSLPMMGGTSLRLFTSGNDTLSLSTAMDIEQPNQRQHQQQEHTYSNKSQSDLQIQESLSQHAQKAHSESCPPFPSPCSPPAECDCIVRLSALLQEIKRPVSDTSKTSRLDDALSRVDNALTQWARVAACQRCQEVEPKKDDGETLLLAAMSMRRVVVQFKEQEFWLPSPRSDGTECVEEDDLRIGAFQVTGSDRVMLLGVLRTITVRKLDAAVTKMQGSLRTKQQQQGEEQSAVLNHVESILEVLAKTVKSQ